MELDKITFNEISEVWASNLWKDRQSPIKHISSMVYLGGYDMSIYNNEPTFFSIKESGKIIAVNSGHMTINGYYRSRGLWVKETYWNKGLTYILFNALCDQALSENAEHIWSYPRQNSVGAYLKNSFFISSTLISNDELGPHYYVMRSLDQTKR